MGEPPAPEPTGQELKEQPMYPFGHTMQALEEAGYSISHYFEDLVFPSPGDFLIQFAKDGQGISLYLPDDMPQASAPILTSLLKESFSRQKLDMNLAGQYRLDEKEGGELEITFLPA